MQSSIPFLADIGDIIGGLVPCVAFVIWIVSQMMGAAQQQAAKKAARAAPRPREVGPEPVVAQAVGEDELNDEIQQFLQRANRARGAETPAEVVVLRPQQSVARLEMQQVDEPTLASSELAARHAVEAQVRQHFGTRGLAHRPDRLSDRIEMADEQMEQRLHGKFDHRVGKLANTTAQTASAKSAAVRSAAAQVSAEQTESTYGAKAIINQFNSAVDFANLLANPQSLRQAIVLNEILKRPDPWA